MQHINNKKKNRNMENLQLDRKSFNFNNDLFRRMFIYCVYRKQKEREIYAKSLSKMEKKRKWS